MVISDHIHFPFANEFCAQRLRQRCHMLFGMLWMAAAAVCILSMIVPLFYFAAFCALSYY